MNILLLCYEYPPLGGGGGVGAKQYAEAWSAKGHRVTVITSRANGLAKTESVNGVDLIRVFTFSKKDRATTGLLSMFSYLFFGFCHLLLHFRELKTNDVINTHFSIPTGPLGLVASRLLYLPNLLTIIGGDIYDPSKTISPHTNPVLKLANEIIINSADKVVAISRDTKKRAEGNYQIKNNIEVVNYGFIPFESKDHRSFGPARSSGSRYCLIAVGRLVKRKGFEYLIRSLNFLPSDIQLTIVGDGPLENDLKNLAAIHHLQDRVIFAGYQSREQIFRLMKESDCFVLSSLHEGLGIVVQEAMYAGLPVVSTNNGGQVDLIIEPRNGILVEPENEEALAAAIMRFYSQRSLGQEVGNNNSNDIKALYMDKNSEIYLQMFRELTHFRKGNSGERGLARSKEIEGSCR